MKLRSLALCAAGLAFAGAACTDAGSGPNARTTQVLLTDAPFPYENVASVEVYINQVDASADVDTSGAGTWTPIAQPLQAFDLLTLQRGSTVLLGNADLPAGSYSAIRMVIDPSRSRIRLTDGSEALVHWPQTPGGLITMHALVEGSLATGPGARIIIDFDVGRSFLLLESSPEVFVFSPWIRAVNEASTGEIAGTVDWSNSIEGNAGFGGNGGVLANATVTVYRGNAAHEGTWWVAATGRTDAQGRYRIAFLGAPNDYIVRFQGTTPEGYGCIQFTNITVERQATTTLNAIVFPVDACVGPDPIPNDTTTGGPDTTITSPGGPVAVVTVTAWLPQAGLQMGDSIPVAAQLTNAQGAFLSGRSVSWSISDPSVLQVQDEFGQYVVLRALRPGSATITATSEGRSGSLTLTVGGATVPDGVIDTVRLSPNGGSVRVGDTLGIIALTYDFPATVPCPTAIAWSVDDTTVFRLTYTLNNYAVVRGLRAGATIVRGACGSRVGAAYYTAWTDTTTGGGGAVANVSVSVWPASPAVNDSVGAYASLTNAAGEALTGRLVAWTVSDTTVLRVTGTFGQSFLMRAVRAGTATISATSEGRTGSASVTVH